MVRSDLCDCSDAYIAVTGDVTVEGANNRAKTPPPKTGL